MSGDSKADQRAPADRSAAAAEVVEAFQEAPFLDRQRFRADLDQLVDQDITPRCFRADFTPDE